MQVIAKSCAAFLLSMNMILVCTISFFVLQSASAVFPACQHGTVGSCLADSLQGSTLKKIQKYYFSGEKRLSLIEDEDAAMQNVLREEEDLGRDSGDSPPVGGYGGIYSKFETCEQTDNPYSDRKVFISFADSVGEILRQKMLRSASNVPRAGVKFSGALLEKLMPSKYSLNFLFRFKWQSR
jgi:hypothetical protein